MDKEKIENIQLLTKAQEYVVGIRRDLLPVVVRTMYRPTNAVTDSIAKINAAFQELMVKELFKWLRTNDKGMLGVWLEFLLLMQYGFEDLYDAYNATEVDKVHHFVKGTKIPKVLEFCTLIENLTVDVDILIQKRLLDQVSGHLSAYDITPLVDNSFGTRQSLYRHTRDKNTNISNHLFE